MSDATHDVAIERAEPDRPNNTLLFVIVVVTLVSLVAVVIAVNELFKATFEREISSKVLEPPSSELRGLRASEQQRLTQYQWVSEKDGVVRIPLDRAIALTLKDYQEGRVRPVKAPAGEAQAHDAAAQPEDAAKPEEGAAQRDEDAAKDGAGDKAAADAAAKPAEAAPKADQPEKPEGEAPKPATQPQ